MNLMRNINTMALLTDLSSNVRGKMENNSARENVTKFCSAH